MNAKYTSDSEFNEIMGFSPILAQFIPESVVAYKKTPVFSENTVPKGLLQDHRTKKGVWGKINILEGELVYTIHSTPQETLVLTPDNPGVVEPARLHYIKPKGKVSFYVEFYK